jgi:hypothetical protein
MATIRLLASPLREVSDGMCSVALSLLEKAPDKAIEAKTVAEIETALDAYAEELKDTGKAWCITTMVAKGQRAPNGYNKVSNGPQLRRFVNAELVTKTKQATA